MNDEDWKNPPPPPEGSDVETSSFKTELQLDPSLRGPEDTVPYVRFDVERYLASVDVPPASIEQIHPAPTPEGGENCILGTESACNRYYARVTHEGGFGTAATLNVWDNVVETFEHSVSQIGTLWRDSNDHVLETVEVGARQEGGDEDLAWRGGRVSWWRGNHDQHGLGSDAILEREWLCQLRLRRVCEGPRVLQELGNDRVSVPALRLRRHHRQNHRPRMLRPVLLGLPRLQLGLEELRLLRGPRVGGARLQLGWHASRSRC